MSTNTQSKLTSRQKYNENGSITYTLFEDGLIKSVNHSFSGLQAMGLSDLALHPTEKELYCISLSDGYYLVDFNNWEFSTDINEACAWYSYQNAIPTLNKCIFNLRKMEEMYGKKEPDAKIVTTVRKG
jgi:hypothetical protein